MHSATHGPGHRADSPKHLEQEPDWGRPLSASSSPWGLFSPRPPPSASAALTPGRPDPRSCPGLELHARATSSLYKTGCLRDLLASNALAGALLASRAGRAHPDAPSVVSRGGALFCRVGSDAGQTQSGEGPWTFALLAPDLDCQAIRDCSLSQLLALWF